MSIDTTYRSDASEMMDDFALDGEMLIDALDKIAKINRLLGGNRVTIDGVKRLIGENNQSQYLILDVGCGNGDMLRELAKYGEIHDIDFRLTGIDANPATINNAVALSVDHSNIEYKVANIFDESISQIRCDIVLCTLTLHHFKDDEIIQLVKTFRKIANVGIVINDLHRSKVAYRLFKMICHVFSLNDMSRDDGLVSILRGFKREELENYSKQLQLKKYSIEWRWAFRYQWIIFNK